jgi:hypothetical protein
VGGENFTSTSAFGIGEERPVFWLEHQCLGAQVESSALPESGQPFGAKPFAGNQAACCIHRAVLLQHLQPVGGIVF